MKFKILIFFLFLSQFSNSQMFDYLKNKKGVKVLRLSEEVDLLYNEFEVKIKELVLWELNEMKKSHEKIEFKSKDLPLNKKKDVQINILSQLKYEITDKEIELDFWYLEKLDYLNSISNKKGDTLEIFEPLTQVEGRFVKKIIMKLIQNEKELMDNLKKDMEVLNFATSSLGGGLNPAVLTIEGLIIAYEIREKKGIQKIVENYSEIIGFAFLTDEREKHLKLALDIEKMRK